MSALIGSSGFIGGHLQQDFEFTHKYNRSNISEIHGLKTDLLICAGLPAEKWKANIDSQSDWSNMTDLAERISSVKAKKAILVSTIDVYQPALDVTEEDRPNLDGKDAYGCTRAWFEDFFTGQFSNSMVIRLPGLFGNNLKKNFIYDLIHNRTDQVSNVHAESSFQFYDVRGIGQLIGNCIKHEIALLNVATEPIVAQEIAEIFGRDLKNVGNKVAYNIKSIHAEIFNGKNGYLKSRDEIKSGILSLMREQKL
jgi:nucleoside-diphosphate-sugar epimerase